MFTPLHRETSFAPSPQMPADLDSHYLYCHSPPPDSNITLPLLYYPYSKSLPFTAIVLLYCSLLPQSHSPSTGSSSSSIGLSPYTLTVPLQHHSPCSAIIVPFCCGSSSTVKVLPNYYGPHSIIIPSCITIVPNLWQ